MIKAKYSFLMVTSVIVGMLLLGSSAKAAMNGAESKSVFYVNKLSANEMIKLDGNWEFYWQKLYTPKDFKQNAVHERPMLAEVPQTWSNYMQMGQKLPQTGYATYRLQVEFSRGDVGTIKALYMPSVASAYSLWINGVKMSKNGAVGTSRYLMKPERVPNIVEFEVNSLRVEFIIQASNYNGRKAGITDSLLIGEPNTIIQFQEKRLIFRSMIVMSLVLMGLYHSALFAFRRKEPALIFFGIACIVVAIRAILLEERLASYLLSFLNWEMARKLEYLGASLGVLFSSLFSYMQFTGEMNRRIRNVIIASMSAYSLFIMLTPALVFTRTMVILQACIILIIIYLLYVYIKAFLHKREGSKLNLVAIFMLFLTVVNDILFFNNFVHTTELTSVGVIFFLFTQSIILSKRYSLSFIRLEKLSQDLAILNASLEKKVQKRTAELEQANFKLHGANLQLKDAHTSRSKWIHNITHEISAPLTGIRAYSKGMLDGVVPSDQTNIQLVYDQSVYVSQMLNDLRDMADIENQQIKFELKGVRIQDFIRNLYEKYKMDIEKKAITFELRDLLHQRHADSFVLMDPMRIEQVIVNLLRNAQRFVQKDGIIVLELDRSDENNIVVKVKDNGIGINEDELELIFNRFYRGRNQGESHQGSGLGLAISMDIVDYHHGELSVKSKVGKGSCFYFTLPVLNE
ncbi:ATP-binding protein [Niallia sp. Sow4_A1]|uniref:sensor histidine kinase n=1 Tax=Niallia sp. Sow4_A1 TaxID=3438793 RepID=UPI003F954345